jgi:Tfp pilus assembly protein PilF
MRAQALTGLIGMMAGGLSVGVAVKVVPPLEPPNRRTAESLYEPPSRRGDDIAFYEARASRDPYGARDRAVLASLYLARARGSGSDHDLARAEELARESDRLRSRRNAGTAEVLAATLMAQHKFAEAYEVMGKALARDSSDLVHRATLGEIALELGNYHEADRLFGSVALSRFEPAIGIRYARWLEVNGRSAEARALFETLRARLAGGFRIPAEQLAWLDLRIGELAARNGQPALAKSAFRRGLALLPDDARLLGALARLSADRGAWADAIQLGERALAQVLDPATLITLWEAHAATGNRDKAKEYERALEVALSGRPGAMHRAWALFLLDRGLKVNKVVTDALQELSVRRDVYGYDLAAWALLRAGRFVEAGRYADSAVSRGTCDAGLNYRAGRVALGAGDSTVARARLRRALEINPRFHPSLADTARRILEQLPEP